MSGGQRTRAALARALLANPDILLLDEPTNHLDIEAIEWLEGFLSQWKGTLVLIAHDRRFLNKVTTRTLDMEFTKPKSFTWFSKSGELREGGEQVAFSRLQDYPAANGRGEPEALARCPDLEIERGERVALIGPNGVGKTTLLKTIMGELRPLAGHLELGHNVKFGYYSQTHEGLNASNTVMDEVRSVRSMTEQEARDLLAKMLFTGDNLLKQIGDLSGGERSRVALTKLTLTDANFLILDEPTNHLDLDAQEALTEVLSNYEGTLL